MSDLLNTQLELVSLENKILDDPQKQQILDDVIISLTMKLKNGTVLVYPDTLQNSVFIYITGTNTIITTSSNSYIDITQKNFNYVIDNGLGVLRTTAESIPEALVQTLNAVSNKLGKDLKVVFSL